ncbi:MAG: hypothetical protein ACRC9V_16040 [Aeromonas sp.]
MDADTLSRCPLDINKFLTSCIEVLNDKVIQAAWKRSQVEKENDVAWTAALSTQRDEIECQLGGSRMTLESSELRIAQREDPALSKVIELKASGRGPMSDEKNCGRRFQKTVI